MKKLLSIFTLMLLMSASGAWAQDAKHLITATYREQTRSLEQPLPYATTIGALYEAVTGEPFSDLISSMSSVGMPLTGITSRNTSVVSIGELYGASTPVTVNADGETNINLIFGSYVQGIFVNVVPPLYANVKDGVKDADKWTVKVGNGDAQWLPIGGLKGDGSETVTLQYNGRLKVKGVKATVEAPAPSVPDGAINGKFSVNATKQVYFSKGNLRYASGTWSFFDNQYEYYTSYSADAWDHFGWSTSATTYGMNTSTSDSDYSGDFVDWGATMGTGWFTLSSAEWEYLFNTRSASTVGTTANARYAKARVNNVYGMILFPDTYTHPDGVTAPKGVNVTGDTGWYGNNYSSADWTKMESAGCVFLPAAGYRNGSSVYATGSGGDYWSTTSNGENLAYDMRFNPNYLELTRSGGRCSGYPVRLVREVATSDEQAAVAQVITWNSSNISDLRVRGTFGYEKEGVTLSANSDMNEAKWRDKGEDSGIRFEAMESGGFTFTAPTGKKFTKIEMTLTGSGGWDLVSLGTGWSFNGDPMTEIYKVTWKGSAASMVGLLTGTDHFSGELVNSIVFTLVDAE